MTNSEPFQGFRYFYRSILEYEGDRLSEDRLLPRRNEVRVATSALSAFRQADGPAIGSEDLLDGLWDLYALSRINDYLLLAFQGDERGCWDGPAVSQEQYLDFFVAAGFTPLTSNSFAPFRHEIVKVRQSKNAAEPIRVERTVWPGLMFGEMLFSRSGVVVSGGIDYVSKRVAEGSTLYFTHCRLHRKTNDLSLGWGSNSQWRTNFRRDYEHEGRWSYHVDGERLLDRDASVDGDEDELSTEERIELCKNRCFIRSGKSHVDLWPYNDRYEEPITS